MSLLCSGDTVSQVRDERWHSVTSARRAVTVQCHECATSGDTVSRARDENKAVRDGVNRVVCSTCSNVADRVPSRRASFAVACPSALTDSWSLLWQTHDRFSHRPSPLAVRCGGCLWWCSERRGPRAQAPDGGYCVRYCTESPVWRFASTATVKSGVCAGPSGAR